MCIRDSPSTTAKVSSTDIEEGEITDSDTEQTVTVLTPNVASVADKENAGVGAKSSVKVDAQRSNQRNTNCAKQTSKSDREKALKSTGHASPRKRSPSSGRKSRSSSDTRRGDRRRSPQRKPTDDRRDRRAVRELPDHSSEHRTGSCLLYTSPSPRDS